jgi:kumamolisin
LCCGGTRLTAAAVAISAEMVWNEDPLRSATGGGVSDFFALPVYQIVAGVPPSANPGGRIGRGVPDVAADADPATGYEVRVDGQSTGLVALTNQKLRKPVGFLNPLLYNPAGSRAVLSGHHRRQHRRLPCQAGLGPMYWLGQPKRCQTAAGLGRIGVQSFAAENRSPVATAADRVLQIVVDGDTP